MARTITIAGITLALLAFGAVAAEEAAPAGEKDTPPSEATEKAAPAGEKDAASPEAAPKLAPTKVTVVSVTGIASKRLVTEVEGKWQPLRARDQLSELTIIRTGLGARVVLDIADRGLVTVKSATKVGIRQFRMGGTHMRARLGLKYGSVGIKVDAARGASDLRVATPVGTLAVRGTRGGIAFSGDMGLFLHGTAGTWRVSTYRGRRSVRAGEWTNGRLTPSVDLADKWRDTQMGDPFDGVTVEEAKILRQNGGGRGILDVFSPVRSGGGSSSGDPDVDI